MTEDGTKSTFFFVKSKIVITPCPPTTYDISPRGRKPFTGNGLQKRAHRILGGPFVVPHARRYNLDRLTDKYGSATLSLEDSARGDSTISCVRILKAYELIKVADLN